MKNNIHDHMKGQVLVLFAVGLTVLIAFSVLVLDGGMLFLNRRAAQTAADAGALAGARIKCNDGSVADVIAVAEQYAEVENSASAATASWDGTPDGDVVVDVTIQQDTFLAQVLEFDNFNVPASAAANCFTPLASQVLPVAWTCRPPVAGYSTSEDCQIQALDWDTEMVPLINSNFFGTYTEGLTVFGTPVPQPFQFEGPDGNITNQVYIIMDSANIIVDMETDCMPTGTINCDFDGDGVSNIAEAGSPGDRSWLLLEEGRGASDIRGWIENGLVNPLTIHTWLAGASGVTNAVFMAVADFAKGTVSDPYNYSVVPIFDDYCPSGSYATCLSDRMHSGDTVVANGPNNYFHIIGFAAFYVTCVDDGGSPADNCPAATVANLYASNSSIKLIEGYFVSGVPVAVGPVGSGGVDMGINLVSLTR